MSRSKGLYSLSNKGRSSPCVQPYNCEEGRLLDLVGDLLAQTVRDYLVVGKALKDLEAERKRGFYDREIAWERKSNASWEFCKTKKQAQKELERYIEHLREKDASWANRASVRANKKEFAWFIADFESDLD